MDRQTDHNWESWRSCQVLPSFQLNVFKLDLSDQKVTCVTSVHQAVRRGRSEVGEEEVDPLFRGRHSHHFLRGAQRIRPGAAWGRDHGKDRSLHPPHWLLFHCVFLRALWPIYEYWNTLQQKVISAGISNVDTFMMRDNKRNNTVNSDTDYITASIKIEYTLVYSIYLCIHMC